MKKIIYMLALSGMMSSAWAAENWNYQHPEAWAKIDSRFAACTGMNQSPINIEHSVKANIDPLKFNYHTLIQRLTNNGHTVQVDFTQGGELNLDGEQFELKQFHLHTPSENTIKGKSYPLEIHFVHANSKGELAVVAMMYEQGKRNQQLANMWEYLPKQAGQSLQLNKPQPVHEMLPKHLGYFRFSGSLTTPPCTEGVRWLVLKEIQQASKQQIENFAKVLGHPNNRPIQPLYGRVVVEN